MSYFTKKTQHIQDLRHGISMIRKDGEGDKDCDSTAYNMVLVNETERFIDSHLFVPLNHLTISSIFELHHQSIHTHGLY